MARAKRTVRTDARRRYRQSQLAAEAEGIETEDPAAAHATAGQPAPPPARPSFTAAFRQAYHRANIREDLPYLPALLLHWSFWVPVALMIVSAVATAVAPTQPLVRLVYQTFVFPPALIVMFITGFFTKRASYLLGAILGVLNVIVYGGLISYIGGQGLGGEEIPPEALQSLLINALLVGPPSGILFTSLAAWYRRFLYLTNPNRGRRPPPKGKAKPARS